MALSDVTAEGVERALDEFDRLGRDAFLDQFGFGRARGYFLIRGGRHYDSKAVVGVAHGYDRPDLGPLLPQGFSGGEATVARLLESLGFDVERHPRNHPWAEEELILALELYLRSGLLEDSAPAVLDLSRVLSELTAHSEHSNAVRFRNPGDVALKLANFAAIDPNYDDRDIMRGGRRDTDVWDQYASDEDALAATATLIRARNEPPRAQPAVPTHPHVTTAKVEAQYVEQFQVSISSQVIEATRREQRLVLAYVDHLRSRGHRVTRHKYRPHDSAAALVCDLVDETDHVLYEAKGDIRRSSVRMAIGQLIDYRRFEPPSMSLAILLPRQPAQDLIELIRSIPASAVWRTKSGFASISQSADIS